jgi:small nuclear ribonucleoprotein G
MAKVAQPELKRFLDKRVAINIQGGRKIIGTLRGYDIFLNLVIDSAVEQVHPQTQNGNGSFNQHAWVDGAQCGTVVSSLVCFP